MGGDRPFGSKPDWYEGSDRSCIVEESLGGVNGVCLHALAPPDGTLWYPSVMVLHWNSNRLLR